jgi:hypothetical protein
LMGIFTASFSEAMTMDLSAEKSVQMSLSSTDQNRWNPRQRS